MEPFMIVHNTGNGLTCARAATLGAAKHLAANWLTQERTYTNDPARSVAIIYTPEDRLLYFRQPNHPLAKAAETVRWMRQTVGETLRTYRHEAFGWLTQLFQPVTR